MTTNRIQSEYYTSDEVPYKNNKTQFTPRQDHSGVITSKTRNGSYTIIEKDFGDHRVIYHVPIEYGDDYDVSQLEDALTIEDQQQQLTNSPKLVRRRIYQEDNDDDYQYVEEIPVVTPRRRVYVSPRRERDTQVVKRIYERRSPIETVEYIHEDDYSDVYDSKPDNQEQVEYTVRERVPRQTYMEESQPARRTFYVQDPSVPLSSPRPPPPALPPPASYSPRRSPYQPSPRSTIDQKSPSPVRRNNLSPPPSTRKQQTTRSSLIYEPPVKPNIPKTNEPPLRLMDIIAQNRAKRGSRIPKPRREIDEAQVYDPPTYKRNVIKNGFIIHK